ncbi:CRISPR-associated protein Cas4 [Oxalobacter paraformigenes]|uniref:CRISPR-associated exonuclease Cas4 n=1 Tax=Oxalobacter paraformigenes TaxID=556268 RepID=C3X322_9BURK|nr:CRISPR-associated protein Cas4 [Oxalobacter paraformigenes]EEO27608.1 CRISPR-associated protein cas4 [Oxalobacter paraformigenes]
MSFPESDFIPLSALQHILYCPRQCALIHLDRAWEENVFTAEGRILHEKAHSGETESRKTVRTVTSLPLSSKRLGISGVADVVEFHADGEKWRPYPVEYKRGRPKKSDADRVQLCAQALCLEEMLGIPIAEGALYYGQTRRRETVVFDETLRRLTEKTVTDVHALFNQTKRPQPVGDKRCKACSLKDECLPGLSADLSGRYLKTLLEEA